jgi:hypothetical protein
MSIQTTLRDLTDAEQITLVQDVLRGDGDAIATFLRCTQRLLTRIARHAWGDDDIVFVPPEDAVDQLTECVLSPFTYLVYGLRPTGYAETSPLQGWLDHPDQRIPLDKYVATVVRGFLRDMRRKNAMERRTVAVDVLPSMTSAHGKDRHVANDYYQSKDGRCRIEEQVAVCLWWKQRTPTEQTLLDLLSPPGGAKTLTEAAQQLGTSIPTVSRWRKHLRDDFVAFLNAA